MPGSPADAAPTTEIPRSAACRVAPRITGWVLTLTVAGAAATAFAQETTTTTVDFEVSEGTKLAFDISPDGETIVFDLLGQLWLMPAEGGRAQLLTDAVRDTAEDVDPVFSPDGQWIVFHSDRPEGPGLWLVPATGGEPRRLTQESVASALRASIPRYAAPAHVAPTWSPDGHQIVYALPDGLFRLDVETGSASAIPVHPPSGMNTLRRLGSPDWSPAGDRIVFGTGQGGAFRFGVRPDARIWEVGVDGGTATPITGEGIRAVAPTYAPDGSRIAFFAPDSVNRWQLWVQTLAGGSARQLTDHTDVAIRRARWSPDGSAVIYSADGKLWRIASGGGPAQEIPFTARVRFERQQATLPPVRFSEPGTEQPARSFLGLALSPDGDRIAMLAVGRLWVWPVAGSPRLVADVPEGASDLSWSGDGTEVLFTTGDLFATNVRTGTTRRLTALPGPESRAAWSPDGQHIAFTHEGRLRLLRVTDGVAEEPAATLDLGPARFTMGEATRPLWRSDSKALLTYGQPGGRSPTATLLSVDGGSLALRRPPPGVTFLQWPQSDALIYAHGNRLWTATLDVGSGMIGEPTALSDEPALYVSAAANGAILYVSDEGLRLRGPDGRVRTIGWPVTYEVPPAPPPLLIRNARLIDGTGAPPSPARDILIENGRIAQIAPGGTLQGRVGGAVLDAAGRTVIPGLIDLHRHVGWNYFEASRLVAGALYHGTTTVRDAGSDMGQTATLRDLVASGRWPGARVVLGGYIFQGMDVGGGASDPYNQYVLEDDQVARGVAIARAFGADYVKHRGLYGYWASFVATIREAHRHGMRISGHCSSVLSAVAAGVDGQEHTGSCLRDSASPPGVIYDDYARLKAEARLWVTVNLQDPSYAPIFDPTLGDRPEEFAPFLVGVWRRAFPDTLGPSERQQREAEYRRRFVAPRRAQTELLHAAGVPLVVGSDDPNPTALHGVLGALVQVGLSPLEAITAATANAASVIGAEAEIGTIEVGKLADLLILDADPLEDIRNTRRIWQVIQGGRIVDRAALLEAASAPTGGSEEG